MTEPEPPPPAEGRRSPRKRVLYGGKVSYRDGSVVFDCMIRDLSPKGARITLAKDKIIPSHVILVDTHNRMAYEASVMWIRAPQFGLRFDRMHGPKDLPEGLEFVRDLFP